jgi:diguanylate cyclase (GGDEF)-like protein/PAS domain S-box-containing protein
MRIQAEANLSALIESTEDLIWSTDPRLRLITFNRAFQKHFERNFGGPMAPGMGLRELLPPARAQNWIPLFERALKGERFRSEMTLVDGRVLDFSFSPIVVDGETTGVSVFGKDVTEARAAEKKYRDIFEGALEGFYQTTREGKLLTANRALVKMLGYDSPQEAITCITDSARDLWMDPEERTRVVRRIEENRYLQNYECRFKRKDGSPIWVLLNCRCSRDTGGQLICFEGSIQEITARKRAEEQLRDSEAAYRFTFEQRAVGIVHISFEGVYLRCNSRFAEIIGYPIEEVPGLTISQVTPPEDYAQTLSVLEQLTDKANGTIHWEKRYQRKDGSLVWVRKATTVQRDSQGKALHQVSFVEDITAQKRAEQQLRESELRYRTAFQTSIDAININRLSDGLYVDCNQAFLEILGYEREEVIGKTSRELNVWADHRDRQAMAEMLRQNSNCRGLEAQFKKKSGEIVWGEMSASLFEIDGAPCILSITRDISHVKMAETTIRNLAFYDSLTGLPNRRFLSEKLHQILSTARAGHSRALLFIELDHFKTLNEILGHRPGGLLLKEIAQRICACTSDADIVCRIGGDEFAVMLGDLSESVEEAAAQARDVGERIRASIGAPCLLDGRECLTTASIGCTVFGAGQRSLDDQMQEADIALYQAKLAGRNILRFFSPALQLAVNARATLEEDLRQAIKGNQFLLYYQPQVLRSRLIGAEALIRWMHPRNGMVQPDAFIPLAEETGLILPIGDWVLDAACRQIATWAGREETAHLAVAVNISALQFRQPSFVETVLEALERSGANPKNLKLELTESMLVENIEDVITKMTVLKTHGLSFSLDDFGTGYSSLAYLKRLPLDQLKIDRAFVRDMMVDATSGAIAQTIISLGRSMGLSVIAEGVETEEQRGFLAGLGCHAFQGYLFSPPLPLQEFEALL